MLIALISDVHANLPALEAVLADIKRKHAPDMIISLGDQVNLGPCPRETLALLQENDVRCLHGNHEGYVLKAMSGDPAYSGANFDVVRFNAQLLTREAITFPRVMQLEHITLCHALPEDDRFPVYNPGRAIPLLRGKTFEQPTHIICGHGHNPTHIRIGNLTLDSIGAVGCLDDGPPGVAPYTMLWLDQGSAALQPCYVRYDASGLDRLFVSSGLADACPVMARIACSQMHDNYDYLMSFITLAWHIAGERGESIMSEASLARADSLYRWPDGLSTAAYWRARRP